MVCRSPGAAGSLAAAPRRGGDSHPLCFLCFWVGGYPITHPYIQRHAGDKIAHYNCHSPGACGSNSESRENSSSRDAVFIFLPAGEIIGNDMRRNQTLRKFGPRFSHSARPPLATKPLPAISSLDTRLKICHSQISLRFSCSQNLRILTLNNFDNFFIRRLAAHRAKRPSVARLHVVGHHVELLSLQGSRILWLAYTSTYAYMNEMDMGWI